MGARKPKMQWYRFVPRDEECRFKGMYNYQTRENARTSSGTCHGFELLTPDEVLVVQLEGKLKNFVDAVWKKEEA